MKPLPIKFTTESAVEQVARPMVEPRCRCSINFPIRIERCDGMKNTGWLCTLLHTDLNRHACRSSANTGLETLRRLMQLELSVAVLERQLMERLRFDEGGVYTVRASTAFDTSPPLVSAAQIPHFPLPGSLAGSDLA